MLPFAVKYCVFDMRDFYEAANSDTTRPGSSFTCYDPVIIISNVSHTVITHTEFFNFSPIICFLKLFNIINNIIINMDVYIRFRFFGATDGSD